MHAYLIIAHKNLDQLIKLLSLLDYKQNDIYIHIDTKANKDIKKFEFQKCCSQSRVYQYSEFSILWGAVSQIECELFLLQQATSRQAYRYYHLLSGMDLPLKSQQKIHEFFRDKDQEFIHYSTQNNPYINERAAHLRLTHFYNILPWNSLKIMRKIDIYQSKFQRILKINRLKKFGISQLYHGSNWFSITDDLARELVSTKDYFLKVYKSSYCCDEVFIQTYVMMHKKWIKKLYLSEFTNSNMANMRYIDWNRGGPYTWRKDDFNELINSPYLFARKFDENVDQEIIELVFQYVSQK